MKISRDMEGNMILFFSLINTWEADCKHAEVPLQSRVDGEAPSCGVHTGHILHIVNLL